MREINSIFSDNLIKIALISSTILIVAQAVLVVLFYPKFPPLIPFLNNQAWGEERLFPSGAILIVPVVLTVIFLFNNFLGAKLYKKNILIARILSFNCLLVAILSLLALAQIIFLVF